MRGRSGCAAAARRLPSSMSSAKTSVCLCPNLVLSLPRTVSHLRPLRCLRACSAGLCCGLWAPGPSLSALPGADVAFPNPTGALHLLFLLLMTVTAQFLPRTSPCRLISPGIYFSKEVLLCSSVAEKIDA